MGSAACLAKPVRCVKKEAVSAVVPVRLFVPGSVWIQNAIPSTVVVVASLARPVKPARRVNVLRRPALTNYSPAPIPVWMYKAILSTVVVAALLARLVSPATKASALSSAPQAFRPVTGPVFP